MFDQLTPWALAIVIVLLRMVDVSLGTMRTLAVVQGRAAVSVALGFVEVLVWVFAVSQVVTKLATHPWLALAYAGGFALGNAGGIWLERRLAVGRVALRLITVRESEVTGIARKFGHVITRLSAGPADDPHVLIYATSQRRNLARLLNEAQAADPTLFYVIERFAETSALTPLPEPSGWRAFFKKK